MASVMLSATSDESLDQALGLARGGRAAEMRCDLSGALPLYEQAQPLLMGVDPTGTIAQEPSCMVRSTRSGSRRSDPLRVLHPRRSHQRAAICGPRTPLDRLSSPAAPEHAPSAWSAAVTWRLQVVQPDASIDSPATGVDSAAILAGPTPRPSGLLLAPVRSDSMVLLAAADSFTVQLTDRECAAPNNWVVLVSPALDTLSSTMCQETIGRIWPYTDGPYSAGTAILLEFESGVGGGGLYDGQMRFSDTLAASFPEWNLEFEDAGDNDFNDFLLEVLAYPSDTLFSLSLTADTTELHPWVPSVVINGLQQELRAGDTASFTVSAAVWNVPEDEVTVAVSAEFLPNTGGHAHQTSRVAFDDVPNAQNGYPTFGDLVGNAWTGFFDHNSTKHKSFQAETSSGQLSLTFVAGVVGGDLDVIVETEADSVTYADTVGIRIRVPGLINDTTAVTDVYFIGGTNAHLQGANIHATQDVAGRMQEIAVRMNDEVASGLYLQHNDASLEEGGTFTIFPTSAGTGANPIDTLGHYGHALGVDIDIAWCYAADLGFDPDQDNRVGGTGCSETEPVNGDRLREHSQAEDACSRIHGGNHYHIRFTGRCPS